MVLVIERDSEAYQELLADLFASGTYKVSIDVRPEGVAIKRNECMWSPTLKIDRP